MNLRGHSLKLFKSFSKRLCRRNSFSQRVIKNWNSLPVDSDSLNVFKNRLDLYMDKKKIVKIWAIKAELLTTAHYYDDDDDDLKH
jgi:hypothetical protein